MAQIVSGNVARIHLIAKTDNAERMAACVTRTYEGILDSICTPEQQKEALGEIQKTSLQGPLEMIHFTFLVKDVTRAFTHQMVRTRVGASYAQESLRFVVKKTAKILATGAASHSIRYEMAADSVVEEYNKLIKEGMPVEDARGLLPTNIMTSIFVTYSFRTLITVYRQRTCCQAQPGEWTWVMSEMKRLVSREYPTLGCMLKAPGEYPGGCGFNSKYDRICKYEHSK